MPGQACVMAGIISIPHPPQQCPPAYADAGTTKHENAARRVGASHAWFFFPIIQHD